jgi:hypothetical protein
VTGRDEFEDVVRNLDAVVRRHPAGSGRRTTERTELPAELPENVVDLRSRLATARTGGYPDDAA